MFFTSRNKLVFFNVFFISRNDFFFGNWQQLNPMRALGRKKSFLKTRLSSMYLPTVGQRLLKVIKPTVILSTSAHRQLQTSILRAFADIGPTLAQCKKANGHFVNVSPPSATNVYPPCICRHWANVGSK